MDPREHGVMNPGIWVLYPKKLPECSGLASARTTPFCDTTARFMGSEHLQKSDVNRGHEPSQRRGPDRGSATRSLPGSWTVAEAVARKQGWAADAYGAAAAMG